MKTTVIGYIAVLALAGLVSLGILGASLLQRHDNRGIAVLALVVGGLLLTFIYGLMVGRAAKAAERRLRTAQSKVPQFTTMTIKASADFAHSPSSVWALIRPAESSLSFVDGIYHAVSIPAVADGPGELQCFFHRNGQIGAIEVLQEIPEQLAVTRSLLPAGGTDTETRYRLEETGRGSRLTIETDYEVPGGRAIETDLGSGFWDSYFERVGAVLDRQAAEGRAM
ncbi:hypothetical protein [Paenarthrobacter sp. JL.01a]|uniref:hypothetical protein n=1 Tax=Paenarthrobacter sp. JL.01a TaxID=2979324 RepID=UPI0021C8B6EE|nr:hypothetical protein [Paenarthrobacter sp. JL.01a]UXM92804.1 hypothetical protein N5P29_05630 [Paenarthrobacter sp. JL.01a]